MSANSSPRRSRAGIADGAGASYALAAALLFGATTPLASILARSLSPLWLSAALYCGVAILLGGALAARRSPVRRVDLPWLALSALVGGVAGPVLFVVGLRHTDAASASLLLAAEPPATALIAWLVVGEHAARRTIWGMIAVAAGAAVLGWQGSPRASVGSLAVLAAALCWGIDNNLAARIVASRTVDVTGLRGLVAAVVALLLALLLRDPFATPAEFAAGAALGLVGYGVSLVLFMRALRRLGAARTGAYFATAPFVGAVLSLPLEQNHDLPRLGAAGALMALGVCLHAGERHEHAHEHAPLEHEHPHDHEEHHRHAHTATDPPGDAHTHRHVHAPLVHAHPHAPDTHHRHDH